MNKSKEQSLQPIKIKGARVNNLKNVDVEIPANKLVAFRVAVRPLWRLILFLQRDRGVMWRVCHLMQDNFSAE